MMVEKTASTPLDTIFSIKHEPKRLADIAGHEETKARLFKMIESHNVSNLLIAGSEGCGKLTLAKCFAREFFGEEYATSVSIIHAANPLTEEERKQADRDSHVSEKRIGSMAGETLIFPKFIQARVKPVVEQRAMNSLGYKILIVTDFHLLGQQQQGFRRLMETYGANCRFILLTTQISSVIDPIVSRCQVLLVNPITRARFYKELTNIGTMEEFKVSYTFINSLYYVTGGNIGKVLNLIQIFKLRNKELNDDNLFEIIKDLDSQDTLKFLEQCLSKNEPQAMTLYFQVKRKNAWSLQVFLDALRKTSLKAPLPQLIKARIIDAIAQIDAGSVSEASDEPHIMSLIYKLGAVISTEKRQA
jgi:replication factor C small subunit